MSGHMVGTRIMLARLIARLEAINQNFSDVYEPPRGEVTTGPQYEIVIDLQEIMSDAMEQEFAGVKELVEKFRVR